MKKNVISNKVALENKFMKNVNSNKVASEKKFIIEYLKNQTKWMALAMISNLTNLFLAIKTNNNISLIWTVTKIVLTLFLWTYLYLGNSSNTIATDTLFNYLLLSIMLEILNIIVVNFLAEPIHWTSISPDNLAQICVLFVGTGLIINKLLDLYRTYQYKFIKMLKINKEGTDRLIHTNLYV